MGSANLFSDFDSLALVPSEPGGQGVNDSTLMLQTPFRKSILKWAHYLLAK